MPDTPQLPFLIMAVDVILLTASEGRLSTLVYERHEAPFEGDLALPGGIVRLDESLEAAARRLLRDKGGLESVYLEQLYTFGSPQRDPRSRVISVAYCALVDSARLKAALSTRVSARVVALEVPWSGETGGPVSIVDGVGADLSLAFDHQDMLGMAVKRIRGKLGYTPIGFQLLPESFTLRDLQQIHETILGHGVNKDSFRRRMLASGELEATGERQQGVGHRPAELYRFVRRSAI